MPNKLLPFLILVILSACARVNPEELDRLTKEDPAFKQMILARDQMRVQIRSLKDDLLNRKKTIDAQVDRLRAEYDAYAKAQNQIIEKCQAAVEANVNLLRRDVETASAQLEAKKTELNGHERSLADVRKLLKESKAIRLSTQEKQKWEERIQMISEQIRPLREDIQNLELEIRLKKQKINYLR